jgi:hypothetical protein
MFLIRVEIASVKEREREEREVGREDIKDRERSKLREDIE